MMLAPIQTQPRPPPKRFDHISYSAISTFQTCSLRFFFKNVLGLPVTTIADTIHGDLLRTRGANANIGGAHFTSSRRRIIRLHDRQAVQEHGPRKNEQIRISPIRLIGAEGEQLGIVPTFEALTKAREAGLDLVEVAADERPPVCRILDYGKMRFATSQKGNKSSKVRQQKLKEIRVRPKTDDHDIDTKVNQARKFLEHNDKVQVTVTFRGREMQHQEEGRRVLDAVLAKLATSGTVERAPKLDGKKMTALIMPNKSAAKPKPKQVEKADIKKPVAAG